MGVSSNAMAQAIKTAQQAVTAVQTTGSSIDTYHSNMLQATATGIAAAVNPALGTGISAPGMDIVKLSFLAIAWAQFGIFESFEDNSKRQLPEPFGSPAVVNNGSLIQGDSTPNSSFLFTSKIYTKVTDLFTGTMVDNGDGTFTDSTKNWYDNEIVGLIITDAVGHTGTVATNVGNTFSLAGSSSVVAGGYTLSTNNPSNMVVFCDYNDSSTGGTGSVKVETTFNGGTNWQTVLDTASGLNHLDGNVLITDPGTSYAARITLTNDATGNGPTVTSLLIGTDPSPWSV